MLVLGGVYFLHHWTAWHGGRINTMRHALPLVVICIYIELAIAWDVGPCD
jgi:hypothetical protein